MKKRHRLHRNNLCRLGGHFFNHAKEMGMKIDSNMEQIMQHFKLYIITAVEQYSIGKLKYLQSYIMQIMQITSEDNGLYILDQNNKHVKKKDYDSDY